MHCAGKQLKYNIWMSVPVISLELESDFTLILAKNSENIQDVISVLIQIDWEIDWGNTHKKEIYIYMSVCRPFSQMSLLHHGICPCCTVTLFECRGQRGVTDYNLSFLPMKAMYGWVSKGKFVNWFWFILRALQSSELSDVMSWHWID